MSPFGVGGAVLTCGCTRNQRAEVQLAGKREDLTKIERSRRY
jgi:hypothetical protein